MSYITSYDYQTIIRESVKALVTNNEDERRTSAEAYAIEEISGYLANEYDVEAIFGFDARLLEDAATYDEGQLVIDPDTGAEYICIADGAAAADIAELDSFLPIPNRAERYDDEVGALAGDLVYDTDRVKYLLLEDVAPGDELATASKFLLRSNYLVMLAVDISVYHYHSRTASNQIPQIRIERYLDAIEKLKSIRKGMMQPPLPRHQPASQKRTGSIEMYSNEKRDNGWGTRRAGADQIV